MAMCVASSNQCKFPCHSSWIIGVKKNDSSKFSGFVLLFADGVKKAFLEIAFRRTKKIEESFFFTPPWSNDCLRILLQWREKKMTHREENESRQNC